MRQVREVLRLKYLCSQSGRRIAAAVGISRYTVAEYLRRAAVVGITWPVPSELDDAALERKLFIPPGAIAAEIVRPQPDWVRIHAEMRRPGVTLLLLWEEYRAGQPEGYGYSRYVAARVMLYFGAIPLARGKIAVCLTQHKLRLRLADLTQFEVRHGSAVYFRQRRRPSGSRSTLR
jgi:hypothetical protein